MLFRISNAKKVAGSWELSVVSCQLSDFGYRGTEGQKKSFGGYSGVGLYRGAADVRV